MKTLHLFAGAGGGILADLILGHRPFGAVELDPYCCAVLRERVDDGWFPGMRVHEGDIRLFDPSEYAGRVDCVSGGFPCQDVSAAGRGAGIDGDRSGLWSEFARVLGVVRPRYAFIENSPMLAVRGLDRVLSDLAALGYDAEWTSLSASEVGAPHIRERIWILAYASRVQPGRKIKRAKRERIGSRGEHVVIVADTDEERRHGRTRMQRQGWRDEFADSCRAVPHANRSRLEKRKGQRGDHAEEQSPAIRADWWELEPGVGRVAHGVAARVHRLKALGNGQVPLQAAVAWSVLMGRIAA